VKKEKEGDKKGEKEVEEEGDDDGGTTATDSSKIKRVRGISSSSHTG